MNDLERNPPPPLGPKLAALPGEAAGFAAVPAELVSAREIPREYKRWRALEFAETANPGLPVVRVGPHGRNMGQVGEAA